jgi:type IV pilus assembly protein PilN
MIKVNLLASGPGADQPRDWLPREQRSTLLGLGLLVVTALSVGGFWFYQASQIGSVDTRIGGAETELTRLKQAAKVVEQLTAKKAELSERLALIDRLRAGKRGPVNLLEIVSRSVPDGLWLLEIKQAGSTVQVDGRAMSLTAVTDFAERMQNSGLFQHPVEILTTATETFEETTVVRFSVKADAALPPPVASSVPPNSSAAAAVPTIPGV